MDQKYLTDSESLSLNINATCLLLSSPRNFPYEIKMDKYRPYPSMISMFTSDSQHPPRSSYAVHLGDVADLLESFGESSPDPNQVPEKVKPNLVPNCMTLWW